jgi:TRAP-type C4-dicarboxylate transport system permease small subunit
MDIWNQLDEKLGRAEQIMVALFLSVMILIAFLQIVLRNFFSTGISWGDSLIRYLVVWVGFIGAALATKEGKHISIEVASKWITGPKSYYFQVCSNLISAAVCGCLTYAAIKFLIFEAQMGTTSFFDLPAWIPEIIIPVTFAIMTLRFTLRFINELIQIHFETRREKQR